MNRRHFLTALAGAAVAAKAATGAKRTHPGTWVKDHFGSLYPSESTVTCCPVFGFEVGDMITILAGTGKGTQYRVLSVSRSTLTISAVR